MTLGFQIMTAALCGAVFAMALASLVQKAIQHFADQSPDDLSDEDWPVDL